MRFLWDRQILLWSILLVSFGFGAAIKDYYTQGIKHTDAKGNPIDLVGFYEDITTTSIVDTSNKAVGYIEYGSLVGDDLGVLFLSRFNAETIHSHNKWGECRKDKSTGEYFGDKNVTHSYGGKVTDVDKYKLYFQLLKEYKTEKGTLCTKGTIYKIDDDSTTTYENYEQNNKVSSARYLSDKKKIFMFSREYTDYNSGTGSGGNRGQSVILIDLEAIMDSAVTDSIIVERTTIALSQSAKNEPFLLGDKSKRTVYKNYFYNTRTSTYEDLPNKKSQYDYSQWNIWESSSNFNSDYSKLAVTIQPSLSIACADLNYLGYLNFDWRGDQIRSCSLFVFFSERSIDMNNAAIEKAEKNSEHYLQHLNLVTGYEKTDDTLHYANTQERFNHVHVHPSENWIMISDELAVRSPSEVKRGLKNLPNTTLRSSDINRINKHVIGSPLHSYETVYNQDEFENIGHEHFSESGEWIYAVRAIDRGLTQEEGVLTHSDRWKQNPSKYRGLFRINARDHSIVEQLYVIQHDVHGWGGEHFSVSSDDRLTLLKNPTDPENNGPDAGIDKVDQKYFRMILINNETKSSKVLLEYEPADFPRDPKKSWEWARRDFYPRPVVSESGKKGSFIVALNKKTGNDSKDFSAIGIINFPDSLIREMDQCQKLVRVAENSDFPTLLVTPTEVTQYEYFRVTGKNPSSQCKDFINTSDLPVTGVSWYDAVEYCNKRSEKEGLGKVYTIQKSPGGAYLSVTSDSIKNGYRLPTEEEWKYLYLGGVSETFYGGFYFDPQHADDYCWYEENSNDMLHSAGQKKPNGFGLYDMAGNVTEWTNSSNKNLMIIMNGMVNDPISGMKYNSTTWGPAEKSSSASKRGFRVVRNAPIDMTPLSP